MKNKNNINTETEGAMYLSTLKELGYKIETNNENGILKVTAYKGAHIVTIHKSAKYDILSLGYLGRRYYNDGFKNFNDLSSNHKAQIIHQYTKGNPFKKIVTIISGN